jgi:hypothetical protein
MMNKRPGMPNTNVPMTASQSSYSRSSVKKVRSERGTLGTDGEQKSEVRDCYGIVSGNFSSGRKCARGRGGVDLSKVQQCEELT